MFKRISIRTQGYQWTEGCHYQESNKVDRNIETRLRKDGGWIER